ncbi:MAG: hypothetical protein IPJ69_10015 [Deltaproteobacteria bacterium]|nr:MAG: hypothetical protein IPJ69_10015 [Deltaproteobacteria bacterium]
MIPTPDEQKARFLLALKGEIINSLHKIPGVVDVDVVLNVPDQDEFSTTNLVQKRPTASVIIRTTNLESVTQTVTEAKIQKFVANTIPNMDPNDVAVIISRTMTQFGAKPIENAPSAVIPPSENPSIQNDRSEAIADPENVAVGQNVVTIAGMSVNEDSAGRLKMYIAAFLLVLVALSAFLIFNVLRMNRMRMKVQRGSREVVPLAPGQGPNLLGGQGGGDFGALGGANTGQFDNTFNQGNPGGGGTF